MSDWKQGFYEAVKHSLRLPAEAEVISFEEETESSGGCHTCYSEYQVLEVTYLLNGEEKTHRVDFSMSEFVASLLEDW